MLQTGQTNSHNNDRVTEATEHSVQTEAHTGITEATTSIVRTEQPTQQPVHQFQHEEQPTPVNGGPHP